MRKLYLLVMVTLVLNTEVYSQLQNDRSEFQSVMNQSAVLDLSPYQRSLEMQKQYYTDEQWEALLQKKYLTVGYSPCYVDDFKTIGYFKYNMADDQMEFLKDDQTYYLKKEPGRIVKFTTLKNTYKVYEYNGRLDYFLLQKEGKNPLLVKQIVKYIKPKEPKTSYDEYKPANFLRIKDQYFIAFDDKNLVKLPTNKKKFYEVFGDKSSKVKSFMKKNKLNHKSLGDLEKIVAHYNSL